MITTDFHIHTAYCDGKNTAEQLVKAAIEKEFTAIGFSGHSYTFFDESYCMSKENTEKYREEINALKDNYNGKIEIFCGTEQDYYSLMPTNDYDYVIGSVHYIFKDGKYLPIDESAEKTTDIVKKYYNGDFYSLCEDYFNTVSDVVYKTKADIIGHFDLISKFSEINGYAENQRYIEAANKAVLSLIKTGKPFEINTGAIARGYKNEPYPSEKILKIIYQNNGKIIFSSDCHDKDYLGFGADIAVKLAKKCGFSAQSIITKYGLEEVSLL